ncbi:MAG TPA: chemotaxis protein CheW [Gammaproteobacteria bacterium]|nr:chemotaxis protein CheW [Gammaproteobacteria bacterium]
MIENMEPFDLLLQLQQTARLRVGLPTPKVTKGYWTGIGVRMGKEHLLVPIEEILEILPLRDLRSIPFSKTWLQGIINYRGNILPITDLFCFFEGEKTARDKNNRVLVIGSGGELFGLLVSKVFGMFRLPIKEKRALDQDIDKTYAPYVQGTYRLKNKIWPVLSVERVLKEPKLYQVGKHTNYLMKVTR